MKLLILTRSADMLKSLLETQYAAVQATASSDPSMLSPFIQSRLTDAVVLDDQLFDPAALVDAARQGVLAGVPVCVHLVGPGLTQQTVLRDLGAQVTTGRDHDALTQWVADILHLTPHTQSQTAMIGIATAKGGAAKTTTAVLCAESLAYRGARVLLVDTDISNAAIRAFYGLSDAARSYTELADPQDSRGFTAASLRGYIEPVTIPIGDRAVQVDVLLGPALAATAYDLTTAQLRALLASTQQLRYDVVIVDTSPELMRRPMALYILDVGGRILVPCPTGVLERQGAHNLIHTLKEASGADGAFLAHTGLLFVEPEHGSVTASYLPTLRRVSQQQYPTVAHLGVLPRDAKAISIAQTMSAEQRRYASPLHVAPHSRLARTMWTLADSIAAWSGITLPQPAPKQGWIDRLFRRSKVVALPDVAELHGETVPDMTEVRA